MSRTRLAWMLLIAAAGVVPLLAANGTFSTGNPAAPIPDSTGALGTCQTITVPSVSGEDVVGDVNVSIAASHSWIGDLTFRVQAPGGSQLTILNRPGRLGSGAGESDDLATGTPILYDDTAPSGISAESMGAGCAGTIGVTAGCPNNYIPNNGGADTPIAGVGTNLAQYTGLAANGVWTLCVADSAGGDTGTLTSWSLTFTGSSPVELQDVTVE